MRKNSDNRSYNNYSGRYSGYIGTYSGHSGGAFPDNSHYLGD